MKIINIVGAGKLGRTLAKDIADNEAITLQAIINQRVDSGKEATAFAGQGIAVNHLSALPPADITFICTPDGVIKTLAKQLAELLSIHPGSLFVHCSGVYSHEILQPLADKGGLTASLHPMRSFARPDISRFKQAYCAIDGSKEACLALQPLIDALSLKVFPINHEKKALYHSAGVFASNFLITLHQLACQQLAASGVNDETAYSLVCDLMQGSLTNLKESRSHQQALTGPIARGDGETLSHHLQAMKNPRIKKLYQQLGLHTLEIATLDDETRTCLTKLLKDNQ